MEKSMEWEEAEQRLSAHFFAEAKRKQEEYEQKHKDNDCCHCGKNNKGSVCTGIREDGTEYVYVMHWGLYTVHDNTESCNYCYRIKVYNPKKM